MGNELPRFVRLKLSRGIPINLSPSLFPPPASLHPRNSFGSPRYFIWKRDGEENLYVPFTLPFLSLSLSRLSVLPLFVHVAFPPSPRNAAHFLNAASPIIPSGRNSGADSCVTNDIESKKMCPNSSWIENNSLTHSYRIVSNGDISLDSSPVDSQVILLRIM